MFSKLNLKVLIFLIMVFLITGSNNAFAKSRGLERVVIKDSSGQQVGLYEESHALVIGVSDYTNGWPDLPGVQEDIKAVRFALKKQGFNVITVANPNSRELDEAFESFISKYGANENNRLLFYFAGHGYSIKPKYGGTSLGYIVPEEAPHPENKPATFKKIAMSMQRIEEYALNIDAKHAMFLFDSCFSGSLFSITRAIPKHISYKTSKPIRQFITSGSENEEVPDKSIFRMQFVAALDGEGDVNRDGYVTGSELGEFLQAKVINYSKESQHPQYGKIRNPNLDKGDFVFRIAKISRINKIDDMLLYGDRTAIVIGNRNYKFSALKNPVNDAIDISSSLEKKGFKVKLLLDATRKDILKAINELENDVKKPGVMLFYFAGHGVMMDGKSYIIPIGSEIKSASDIKYAALGVNQIFSMYKDSVNMNTRKNKSGRGLARIEEAGTYGHIFAYATSPGGFAMDGTGRNGVYTKHILKQLGNSGMEIHEMFRKVRISVETETNGEQIPNESSFAKKDFYFSPLEANNFDKPFVIFIFDTERNNPFARSR